MRQLPALWPTPRTHIAATSPDDALLYFAPATLQATARRFLSGFDGLVTYAVKANDAPEVLENLVAAGLTAFDVASPAEMHAVRAVSPDATLHYNNPVRSRAEIATAVSLGVVSYSVDCAGELAKLAEGGVAPRTEVAVRLHLPVTGAAYDFGSKFGAPPEEATRLLRQVASLGFTPSMTFHPGTQCADPDAWSRYIETCAEVACAAGVRLLRLNVGGGFAAHRTGDAPDLAAIFAGIAGATARAFPGTPPALVCEPGRAMVADAFTAAARVKAVREAGTVFLNDGIYGSFAEAPILGNVDRIEVLTEGGAPRTGEPRPVTVFGPTCDSLDRLPGQVALPCDIEEGDWIFFHGMGAYSRATLTRFNGYGAERIVTVERLR